MLTHMLRGGNSKLRMTPDKFTWAIVYIDTELHFCIEMMERES